ncbi:MAG: dipeptide epimerase [Ignavibacteriales bacterium]|nr:dipeptide epimerase [Ignavibacteriales bacterium]
MKTNRRSFFAKSLLALGTTIVVQPAKALPLFNINTKTNKKLKLTYKPYTLELQHTFTVATMSRTTTPAVLTEIEYDGVVGYGEASMPPYLGESQESVMAFLKRIDLSKYDNPFDLETILADIDLLAFHNTSAKASIDIALHDLVGKLMGQPWYNIWGFDKNKAPITTFTIGIDKADVVREKTKEAAGFKILKVKLGKENDKEMIETIRSVTDVPLTADPNQGWKDKFYALDMIHWLKDKGVQYIEQPMAKEKYDDHAWLTERSPLPILADESCQRLNDISKIKGAYNGIVIKLMKCTGMREAHKMLTLAKAYNMKVLIGCMTETSCAISAASHLSPMCDWADLDGMLLIKNDLFRGTTVVDGKLTLSDLPGIGVKKV